MKENIKNPKEEGKSKEIMFLIEKQRKKIDKIQTKKNNDKNE